MSKHLAKKDYDGDGKKESPKEEYAGSKDKAIKKAMKKKPKKVKVTEANDIAGFITSISAKKYALAHKYLKQVVEDKLKARITSSLSEPLF